jgi:hypothetical protein
MWGHGGIIFCFGYPLYASRMTEKEDFIDVGRDTPKINLRLPPELRKTIAAAGAAAGRSVNTEIVQRLERSVAQEELVAVQVSGAQAGMVQFLARCVDDLAGMMQPEQREDSRVQLMVELSRSLRSGVPDKNIG